jgi:hypothetical protein
MVHIRDEGSRFDGSIESVWRYLNSTELHDATHKNTRNHQMKTDGRTSMLMKMEQNWNGTWVKTMQRVTVLPPLGLVTEFMEGPLAGSNMLTVYTPIDKDHSQVDVYGEFRSPTLKEAEIEPAVRAWLDAAYNEDAPAIQTLHGAPLDQSAFSSIRSGASSAGVAGSKPAGAVGSQS